MDDPDYVDVSIFSREIHLQNYVGSRDKLGIFIDAWVKTGGRFMARRTLTRFWQVAKWAPRAGT